MRKLWLIVPVMIIILAGAVSVLFLALPAGNPLTQLKSSSKESSITLNQDAVLMSQPITGIDGKLTAISGNTISVTHHYTLPYSVGKDNTVERSKDATFQFTLDPKTRIFRPETWIPYLFKSNPNASDEALTRRDLKVGQFVAVTTGGDLRVASSAPLAATALEVTRIANNVQGAIANISGNTFLLTAPLPPLPASFPPRTAAQQQQYVVQVTPQTEISRREGNSGTPERMTIDQLTKETIVTVYASEDVAVETQLTALLVVPVDTRPAPSPPSPSSRSPQAGPLAGSPSGSTHLLTPHAPSATSSGTP